MDESDFGARTKQIQRRFRGGIFRADDDDVFFPQRMRIAIVMRDVRQFLAGDIQEIRQVVVARGKDDLRA